MTIVLYVDGMSCEGCARAIKNSLSTLEGVGAVSVSLAEGTVSVDAAPDDKQSIIEAIVEAGYDVRPS